jgi:hypothetical protein
MVEQGGGQASWQKAFQPLQSGATFVSPSILYKLLIKTFTIELATSKIPFRRFEIVTSPPQPPFHFFYLFFSHHNHSCHNSMITLCCISNFEAMWNQTRLVTLGCVCGCACSEISLQYVDQRFFLALLRFLRFYIDAS